MATSIIDKEDDCMCAFLWSHLGSVWPDWAIFWTLGNILKPLATINLPQSSPFLVIFCKGVKIIHFSSETISGQLLMTFGDFYLVTLPRIEYRGIWWAQQFRAAACGKKKEFFNLWWFDWKSWQKIFFKNYLFIFNERCRHSNIAF